MRPPGKELELRIIKTILSSYTHYREPTGARSGVYISGTTISYRKSMMNVGSEILPFVLLPFVLFGMDSRDGFGRLRDS